MKHSVLGHLSPQIFLNDYWQKQPLLVRQALPDYTSPCTPEELAGLSLETEVESRLIVQDPTCAQWTLTHGPFTAADFESLPERHWTLLVQAVDLWLPQVSALKANFQFLPSWRLDDIMVSYAVPGGSVGPHFDYYDVFLLQVEGNREWQIGQACGPETTQSSHGDLTLVDEFKTHESHLLTPGDMLYLPPKIAHWGIAKSDSLTFSIGFRAPTLADLLGELAAELSTNNAQTPVFDPALYATAGGSQIDSAYVQHLQDLLLATINNPALIGDCIARYMTTPKYPDLVDITGERRQAELDFQAYENGEPL